MSSGLVRTPVECTGIPHTVFFLPGVVHPGGCALFGTGDSLWGLYLGGAASLLVRPVESNHVGRRF